MSKSKALSSSSSSCLLASDQKADPRILGSQMHERLHTSMVPSLSCLVVVCTAFSPFKIPASFCMCSQTSALFNAPPSLMPDHRYRPGAQFLSSLRTGSLSSSGMHFDTI